MTNLIGCNLSEEKLSLRMKNEKPAELEQTGPSVKIRRDRRMLEYIRLLKRK